MTTTMTTQKRKKRGGGAPAPAPFLTKTYQMVEEGGTEEMISWGEKGTSFVVWKPVEFARDLLPVHFKHNNFSSFIRQLNTYGFHKVVPDRWEFANNNFRRGDQRLISSIRRRKPVPSPHVPHAAVAKTSTKTAGNYHQHPPSSQSNSGDVHSSCSASSPLSSSMPPPQPLPRQLLELRNENKILRKDNKVLNTELAQARCHFQELFAFLSKFADVGKLNLDHLMHQEIAPGDHHNVGAAEMKNKGAVKDSKEAMHKEQGHKLFGVLLKELDGEGDDNSSRTKKKRQCDDVGGNRCDDRPIKMGFRSPWMGLRTTAHCDSRTAVARAL